MECQLSSGMGVRNGNEERRREGHGVDRMNNVAGAQNSPALSVLLTGDKVQRRICSGQCGLWADHVHLQLLLQVASPLRRTRASQTSANDWNLSTLTHQAHHSRLSSVSPRPVLPSFPPFLLLFPPFSLAFLSLPSPFPLSTCPSLLPPPHPWLSLSLPSFLPFL